MSQHEYEEDIPGVGDDGMGTQSWGCFAILASVVVVILVIVTCYFTLARGLHGQNSQPRSNSISHPSNGVMEEEAQRQDSHG